MRATRTYLLSADTYLGLLAGVVLRFALSPSVGSAFAKDVYAVGISVLSIVFAVFFAALAIIMTSSDDRFVQWLEQRGHYRGLITLFKVTLGALFVALLASLVLYVGTSQYIQQLGQGARQSRAWLVLFSALFTYSLVGTAQSVLGAIGYAERRAAFVCIESAEEPAKED